MLIGYYLNNFYFLRNYLLYKYMDTQINITVDRKPAIPSQFESKQQDKSKTVQEIAVIAWYSTQIKPHVSVFSHTVLIKYEPWLSNQSADWL